MKDISWLTARPIAHRGLHDMNNQVWENTLPAFERAAARGFAIECDVHLTSDGVPIVFHDDTLFRLTGTDGFVWQRTAREMKALRVGTTGDHPPSLQDLLKLVHGRVPLVIELKGTPGHDEGLVKVVGSLLKDYGGKAAVMSFDHWLIRDFRRHMPQIPHGLTAWGEKHHEIEAHFSMLANGIDFVSYGVDHLPNRFTDFVSKRLKMPVISWTVRDAAAVARSADHADQMTFEGFDPDTVPTA